MTPAEWLALAERCEKATGPDRELDAAIMRALGWTFVGIEGDGLWVCGRGDAMQTSSDLPELTASLDAIVALVERELPGCGWSLGRETIDFRDKEKPQAAVWLPLERDEAGREAYAVYNRRGATPALALCGAFCRAMAAKETDR